MMHFCAEVASNHHQSLDRCLRFVDIAADIGCHSIKFQLFRIDKLFAPDVLAKSKTHRNRRAWELPIEYLGPIHERSKKLGLQLALTPFDLPAVSLVAPHVDFLKVASYELLWKKLLVSCARTGKPVVLSTGMATLEEVERAVSWLREAGCSQLTLLHCLSSYPAPSSQCNLRAIQTLRSEFFCPVGWSDHTVSKAVVKRAVRRWGASLIEFHLDLDGQGPEAKFGHCWNPQKIASLIRELKSEPNRKPGSGSRMSLDGNGTKQPAACEIQERDWRRDPKDGWRPLFGTRQEL